MIAGIDSKADIELYLKIEELTRLEKEKIEGILIIIERPKKQGTIYISLNDSRAYENGFGIGINDKGYWGVQNDFCVEVFIGTGYYSQLVETGRVGTRHRMRDGSKIHIYNIDKLDRSELRSVENLEYYRDSKDTLPDIF